MGADFLKKYARNLEETGWLYLVQYDHLRDVYISEDKI